MFSGFFKASGSFCPCSWGSSASPTCLGTQPWSLEVPGRENRGETPGCKLPAFCICQELPSTLHLSMGGLQGERKTSLLSPWGISSVRVACCLEVLGIGPDSGSVSEDPHQVCPGHHLQQSPALPCELCCSGGSGRLSINLGLNAGFPGDNGGCSSNLWESLFPLLPSDPGPCFLLLSHSQLPRGSAGAVLGCRQKCQQCLELPGTFCLSSFLMDGPVWRGERVG